MKTPLGNVAPHQYIITTEHGQYLQSYDRIVAFAPMIEGARVMLDREGWNKTKATSKYRNAFLREDRKTTERKIRQGIYAMAPLNE